MQVLPRSAQRYLVGLWALALAVAGGGLRLLWAPPSLAELLAALIFAVMLTVADLTAFEMDDGRIVSIAVAVLIGALTSLAWPALVAAIMLGTICGALARDQAWWNVLSTIAVRWLAAAASVAPRLATRPAIACWGRNFFMPMTSPQDSSTGARPEAAASIDRNRPSSSSRSSGGRKLPISTSRPCEPRHIAPGPPRPDARRRRTQ